MKRGVHYRFYSYIFAFAVAFSCIIGWSSFTMAWSGYIGLSNDHPEADSSYSLIKSIFGIDHAFFLAWVLLLAYLCLL